jgi:hypothetical protein
MKYVLKGHGFSRAEKCAKNKPLGPAGWFSTGNHLPSGAKALIKVNGLLRHD